jgi:hypothetical protein
MSTSPDTAPINFYALIAATGSKEGARARFQSLTAQLVGVQHPTVRQIQANPGDWGIDCFVGLLVDIVAIWQAKFLIDGVGPDQQQEIRESFDQALAKARDEGYVVEAWTLCIPVSFDAKTTKWWDGWKRRKESDLGISIALWDETRLEALILAPDAAQIRANYFGVTDRPEIPVLPLPEDIAYEEMPFIKQLNAAEIVEVESAKAQFFNAEIVRREVSDKGIESEVAELQRCAADSHAVWETRCNETCETDPGSNRL